MEGEFHIANEVDSQWEAAYQHAGFDEDEVALWAHDKDPPEGKSGAVAQYFLPELKLDPPHAFSKEQVEEAESEVYRSRHRIELFLRHPVFGELSPPAAVAGLGAVLRHELEHARQQAHWGNELFFMDSAIVDPALHRRVGQLPGGAQIYNLKPMEMDANAAAAAFIRTHHAEAIDEILATEHANWARCLTEPQDLSTLLARTVGFLYLFRDECVALAEPIQVSSHLRLYEEQAAEIWEYLERAAGIS